MTGFSHIYYVKRYGIGRFKQPCRILAKSPTNGNLLIEFEDGYRMITCRRCVRRMP